MPKKRSALGRIMLNALVVVACTNTVIARSAADEVSPTETATQILTAADVRGGLVVHLGCGDGRLTTALCASDAFLVHGLSDSETDLVESRGHIFDQNLYGRVSAECFDGSHLPYSDDLVNLLVVSDPSDVDRQEMLRVLAPGGVMMMKAVSDRRSAISQDNAVTINGEAWLRVRKPWPEEMDSWTHFLHDASNNAVSRDTKVGPPRRLKWKCGPLWSRSHEYISSMPAMISAGGRVFYVIDEGLTSLTDAPMPARWTLVARDAFNGVLLWKRALPYWRGGLWRSDTLRGRPASIPRRIVGDSQWLYATLSDQGPLEVLDPATGKTQHTIEHSKNTREIVLCNGTLVAQTATVGTRRQKPVGAIVAFDLKSHEMRWQVNEDLYLAQSLAASGNRVVYSSSSELVCLNLTHGELQWRQTAAKAKKPSHCTLILREDLVLEAAANKITARSIDTGETVWAVQSGGQSMRSLDLFVAQGSVWHASGEGITGYDLATGKPNKTIDPSCVQSPGHHLRCYRAKATEQFLITQFRGAEFVSLTGQQHVSNDWIRGACGYGVMPSNGLLYVPPTPCFCYPGVKLTGMLAFAGEEESGESVSETERLETGPAFLGGTSTASRQSPTSGHPADESWPMYRRNTARHAATTGNISPNVSQRWSTQLAGPLTPPVTDGNFVVVAAKDQHTVHAMNASDGKRRWQFTAGGRIDSSPTIYQGTVLFGSADGYLYCLNLNNGQLAWRFRAAPTNKRIVAFNQLESPWRVHGSVLVEEGIAYCTAGRSTYLDGGIWIYGLDVATGQALHQTHLDTWSPTRSDAEGQPYVPSYHMEGTHSDLLVSQGGYIYLGQYKFDRKLVRQETPYQMRDPDNPVIAMDISQEDYTASDPHMDRGYQYIRSFHRHMEKAHPELAEQYKREHGGMNMGDRKMGLHLAATAGFLDDTWFNRTFWMYSANWPGWYHAHRGAKSGQLLVVGRERTFALQAFPTRNLQSPVFTPGDKGYLLVADDNTTEPVLDDLTRGATKGLGYTRLQPPVWHDWIPIRIRGMVLAGDRLFVAGPPDIVDTKDPMASFEGRRGGVLRAYAEESGDSLAEITLPSPPVFDGLIAAAGRLFLSTTDGQVVCLGD